MADMKYTVNKHSEQIDDLQKKSANHEKRIETIETRSMATAPEQRVQMPAPNITVSVPDNIATKDNMNEVLEKAFGMQRTAISDTVKGLMQDIKGALPKVETTSTSNAEKEAIAQKAADKAAAQRYEKADKIYDHVIDRIYYLVNGAIWAAIPKWVYVTFGIVLAAAIGFGIGFFYQWNQNTHLKEVEWQYRRMRTMYSTDADKQYLVNREKEFFTGSFQVQDSIKDNIRYWEKKSGVDKTFTYYAPTEE